MPLRSKTQEREEEEKKRGREGVHELGLGLLAGLMRKPIRRKAAEGGRRAGRRGEGERKGAIVFILMRQEERLQLGRISRIL